MSAFNRFACVGLALLIPAVAAAQPVNLPQTRITAVFPPGAQQGTTVDVTVTGGSDLDEVSELLFSHPGLKAAQKLDAAGNPVGNTFTVSVDAAVRPGLYDLRVRGLFGISNPRIFRVDSLPEVAEDDANNTRDAAKPLVRNTIINARSNGGADVDMYQIDAKAGETIVFRTEAARLDSLMQPLLQLFDQNGRRVGESRRVLNRDAAIVYRSQTDQSLLLKVHDIVFGGGNEFVYRLCADNRPLVDYVMPPLISTQRPTEVTLFGRHIPDGEPTGETLDGVPVFRKAATISADEYQSAAVGADSVATSLNTLLYSGIDGNLICLARYDGGPVPSPPLSADAAGTETSAALSVSLPAEVSGQFEALNDEDIVRFDAKKGQIWQMNVLSQRLGASSNPVMVVEKINRAEDGSESFQRLALEDDSKQNPGGNHLPTLTTDPSFTLTVPEDGSYRVRLYDRYAASRGSADLIWHLSIQQEKPDFRVVVFDSQPSTDGNQPATSGAVSVRKGGTYEVPVYAYRSGGHNADIRLSVEGLPKGVMCSPAVIPAGQASTFLVFNAAEDAPESAAPVRITASSSTAAENPAPRIAQIATLVHAGANGLPREGRTAGSLLVAVMKDAEPFSISAGPAVVDLTQTQQLLLPIKIVRRNGFDGNVDITFTGQPANVDVPEKVTIAKEADSATARLYFKENAAIGYATLRAYGTAQVPYRRNPWLAERAQQKLDAAQAKLTEEQKKLEESKAQVTAAQQQITTLTEQMKSLEQQLQTDQSTRDSLTVQLAEATVQQAAAVQQLDKLKEQLSAISNPEGRDSSAPAGDFDAALQAIRQASADVAAAAKPVTELTQKTAEAAQKLKSTSAAIEKNTAQLAEARGKLPAAEQAMQTAQAAVTAAEEVVAKLDAEKNQADEALKQANEATKANNLNIRTLGTPVLLSVRETPSTISAAVPNEGAVRKGESISATITITRRPNFTGPVTVTLVLPEGSTVISSDSVVIPAEKTEAVLTLTAAADAAPAAIANAVIRGTSEFGGRTVQFETPIALKVSE